IISFQQAQAAAQAVKQAAPAAQIVTDGDLPQAPAKEAPVAQPAPRADQIRMTVSVAPADAAPLRAAAPQDAAVPVEKQLTQTLAPQSGEPRQSGRDPQAQTPPSAERAQPVRVAAPEKEFAAAERLAPAPAPVPVPADTAAKPAALSVAAAAEPVVPSRSEGARISAPAPPAPLTSVESIERLVERLSVAREFDMSKPASIAVTHREFGALTVTFDNGRSGLDVEIAAKDNDMQRALAQAVAADRPASRAGEPLQNAPQQPSQLATSSGSERGAGSAGQGASSSGAGSSEGERPQHQRDRSAMSSPQDPRNSAAPSPRDDALYA
ncbi:MAG: hypothetical protein KJ703_03395, partial [Alphaproteobacteria bacterium]|nr:hypothetical protein [Alphaproteobacteria bacterium]